MASPAPLAMMPTEPVEAHVLQALLVGGLLALVAHLGGLVVVPLVAELGVVVERDLGVEGVDPTVGGQDQRVDLDQVGVAVDVGGVELGQDVDGAVGGGRVELGGQHPLAGRLGVRPSTGSIQILAMASGFSTATVSISTPPWADSMPRCFLAARSSVKLA